VSGGGPNDYSTAELSYVQYETLRTRKLLQIPRQDFCFQSVYGRVLGKNDHQRLLMGIGLDDQITSHENGCQKELSPIVVCRTGVQSKNQNWPNTERIGYFTFRSGPKAKQVTAEFLVVRGCTL
jgi:hypothetical protein